MTRTPRQQRQQQLLEKLHREVGSVPSALALGDRGD